MRIWKSSANFSEGFRKVHKRQTTLSSQSSEAVYLWRPRLQEYDSMGWVKPYLLGDYAETVLRENAFFLMLRVKSKSKLMSYLVKEHCVIVLRLEPQRKVIATADQENGLNEQWEYIENNLMGSLSRDENLRAEMLSFLESKFEIFADMEAQQKAKADADALFIKTFHLEDESMIYCTSSDPTTLIPGFSLPKLAMARC